MKVTRKGTPLARYLPLFLVVFPLLTIAATFYGDSTPAPDFSGCWWRLGSEDDAFVMLQLQLFPVGDAEAKSRIDAQLASASTMTSPLLPEALDAIGEAALWSRLAGLVRWHRGDGVVLELMISEHVSHGQPRFDSVQRKQMSLRAARRIDQAISQLD
ncbi:hypothetical protein [Solemya velum gill symbiont]|uniref:hypothetical protein n=1 Tax=Solemya velum gill symbiont TaxID=2340 RepID=UPI0009960A5E|nr:hypothetical protein [Solemya velum gill symbiont]OOZ11319.1 hypothetical protein BOW25_12525 [Solemya velum gill symbiont]